MTAGARFLTASVFVAPRGLSYNVNRQAYGDAALPAEFNVRKMIILNKEQMPFADMHLPEECPIAMAYVPWQRIDCMYPPETALDRGTLFPELDKPFMGRGVMGGCRNA